MSAVRETCNKCGTLMEWGDREQPCDACKVSDLQRQLDEVTAERDAALDKAQEYEQEKWDALDRVTELDVALAAQTVTKLDSKESAELVASSMRRAETASRKLDVATVEREKLRQERNAMERQLAEARAEVDEWMMVAWWRHAFYDSKRDWVTHDFTSDAEDIEDRLCSCEGRREFRHYRGCKLGPHAGHIADRAAQAKGDGDE